MGSLLLLLSTLFMGLTAFSDPGTIPRASAETITTFSRRHPHAPILLINGLQVQTKYCHVCGIVRPPRASHCRVSDRCIEKWDHFCPWVGTAIGRRNYFCFLLFILSTASLAVFVAAACIGHLLSIGPRLSESASSLAAFGWQTPPDAPPWLRSIAAAPLRAANALYCAVAATLLATLLAYHLYLVSINQTTYENVRGTYDAQGSNPFDRGVVGNFGEVCCPCAFPPPEPTALDDVERGRSPSLSRRTDLHGLRGGSSARDGGARSCAPSRAHNEPEREGCGRHARLGHDAPGEPSARAIELAAVLPHCADSVTTRLATASEEGGRHDVVKLPDGEPPPSPKEEPWDGSVEEGFVLQIGSPADGSPASEAALSPARADAAVSGSASDGLDDDEYIVASTHAQPL